jgi:plastocyanin
VPARTIAAVALALVLASCGGSDHGGHDNSAVPDGARSVDVVARDFAFEPATIEVEPGEPIRVALEIRNEDHDFVIDEADAHIGGEDGETAVGGFTAPEEPGEYTYYCSVANHRDLGMQGTLVVGQATP